MRRPPTRWPVATRLVRAYGWLALLAVVLLVVALSVLPVGGR